MDSFKVNRMSYAEMQRLVSKWAEEGIHTNVGEGASIEISEDGYWVINGVKTEYKSIGRDGEDGKDGFSVFYSTEAHPRMGEDSIDIDASLINTGERTLQSGDFVLLGNYLYRIDFAISNGIASATLVVNLKGKDGENGVGISKIEKTATNGKIDTYTITLTNGKTSTFTLTNGTDGTDGTNGKSAYKYAQESGYEGTETEFTEGINPNNIREDAKADLKGEVVQELIAELQGLPVFGYIGENKIITLVGYWEDGTYTIRTGNADGTASDIGTMVIGTGKTPVVNLLEKALDHTDLTKVYNNIGYENGKYASASGFVGNDAATFCTGFMPIPASGVFYIKGCTIDTSLNHTRFGLAKKDGSMINTAVLSTWGDAIKLKELGTQYYSISIDWTSSEDYYFYFSAYGTGEGVTVSATPIEE